jgi:hypothetical protein
VRRIVSEWPFLATSTCGSALAPTGSCTVTLIYSPLNQVTASAPATPFSTDTGTLVIESDAASSPEFIDLTGTVTAVAVNAPSNTAPLSSYTLSQGSLTFASTSGGNASTLQAIALTNTGTSTIHVTGLTTTPDFTASSTCATVIAGASCTINVAFTPQASSSQTLSPVISAIEINSDAGTPLNFISLYGTAIPSTLVLSPVALDFGSILVGDSATLSVQVTNGSAAAATFTGITISGDYAITGNTCPPAGSQLPPAASCTMQITFTPAQTGTRTGTISIASSLTQSPLIIALTGTGAQSHLQATPTALTFPATTIGATARLTLSLANTGTAPVSSLSFVVNGDYAITTPCTTTVLAAGASCAVGITFSPTASEPRTGSLTITSSDVSSPLNVPLSGTGLAAGAFTLTVNGASSSSLTVTSGKPANYSLALTAINGYTGGIVLNCTPVNPGQYASCSLLPSSLTLGTATATSTATINTVTSVTAASTPGAASKTSIALCLLPLGIFLLRRTRSTFLAAILAAFALSASGCAAVEPSIWVIPTSATLHPEPTSTRSPPPAPQARRSRRP